MRYTSTRSHIYATDREAIVQGIAPDGGLFVPEHIPAIDWAWADLSYKELASRILSLYFPSLEPHMEDIVAPYDTKFPTPPVALTQATEATILELYHGPTLAFKDMALSVLPKLMGHSLPEGQTLHILTATSGDTGKAALEGFANVPRTRITVFYPEGKVSPIQARQMLTQQGDNVNVFPVKGDFDDCQRGVKEIFADRELAARLASQGIILSSANSINIGRLIPQIVYYIHAYLQMQRQGQIAQREPIHICVPTGNFGNILAAYYAKRMGLPIGRLICASNANRVLTDFFHQGRYDANRELALTSSPSMDILVSSNLERLLYHIAGQQATQTAMQALNQHRAYAWEQLPDDFSAYTLDEGQCSQAIAHAYQQGLLIDPHTAIAYGAASQFSQANPGRILVASTASPYKFPRKILEALQIDAPTAPFDQLRALETHTQTPMPTPIAGLEDAPLRPHKAIEYEQMKEVIQ